MGPYKIRVLQLVSLYATKRGRYTVYTHVYSENTHTLDLLSSGYLPAFDMTCFYGLISVKGCQRSTSSARNTLNNINNDIDHNNTKMTTWLSMALRLEWAEFGFLETDPLSEAKDASFIAGLLQAQSKRSNPHWFKTKASSFQRSFWGVWGHQSTRHLDF